MLTHQTEAINTPAFSVQLHCVITLKKNQPAAPVLFQFHQALTQATGRDFRTQSSNFAAHRKLLPFIDLLHAIHGMNKSVYNRARGDQYQARLHHGPNTSLNLFQHNVYNKLPTGLELVCRTKMKPFNL